MAVHSQCRETDVGGNDVCAEAGKCMHSVHSSSRCHPGVYICNSLQAWPSYTALVAGPVQLGRSLLQTLPAHP
jgi:hypothetical protein